MFGGRRNFIGRVLILFSLAVFEYTIAAAVATPVLGVAEQEFDEDKVASMMDTV